MIPKAIPPVLALLLAACARAPAPQTPAPPGLAFSAVADSLIHFALRETQWGVEIFDQVRNEPVYAHNNERHFIPASNTKLVVSAVALGLLGPDWRYRTPVLAAFAPGDTIAATLIVRGTGDPTMSARFHESTTAVAAAFADSVARHGVRRVGDVVIDATAFDGPALHPAWEIGDLPWYYATRTAAFAFNEAETRMIVSRGDAAAAATVRFDTDPLMPVAVRVRTDTAGAAASIDIDYLAWPDSLIVTGSLAPNRADTSRIALVQPELVAAHVLVAALRQKGVVVTGRARVVRDSAAAAALPVARPLFEWQSAPLSEIAGAILKPSQNWIAEQLLKTLGRVKGTGGSWREGLRVERRYLIDVVRVDSMAFSLSDGSGLSAQNVISPRAFVALLEHARLAPWSAQFRAALPAPGMRGGTLSGRLAGLEDRLAAKTGTISNVNGLSGYLRSVDGREITFSILTNASGRPSSQVRRGMDALVQAVAREKNWR